MIDAKHKCKDARLVPYSVAPPCEWNWTARYPDVSELVIDRVDPVAFLQDGCNLALAPTCLDTQTKRSLLWSEKLIWPFAFTEVYRTHVSVKVSIMPFIHTRSQDFLWGCAFLPWKSWRPFFQSSPSKHRLKVLNTVQISPISLKMRLATPMHLFVCLYQCNISVVIELWEFSF